MNEEIKHDRTGKIITLTFSNEELDKLIQETGIQESNAVATIAVRRFLERWRKKYKKSVKHFLIPQDIIVPLDLILYPEVLPYIAPPPITILDG